MPYLKCLSEDADAFDVFAAFPHIHLPLAELCEAIFRGSSPLSRGQRQMLFAYASALNSCQYCYGGHAAAAVAHGQDAAVFDALLDDIGTAPVDDRLKPLFRLVRKMTLEHTKMAQADVDGAYEAGWDDEAIHSAMACACLASFMNRLIEATGVVARPELFARRGEKAKELGYLAPFKMKLAARRKKGDRA